MSKILNLYRLFIAKLESEQNSFQGAVWTFFFAATLRNFLEYLVAEESFARPLLHSFYHYYLSYICLAIGLIIILHYATREKMLTISRVILPCFIVLNLVPVIDMLAYYLIGLDGDVGYMFPGRHGNFWQRLVTFFGPFDRSGITLGMRCEIALVVFSSGMYVYLKTKNIWRSFIFGILTYVFIFVYCAIPFVIMPFLKLFGLSGRLTTLVIGYFYGFLLFILGGGLFWINHKTYVIAILKDGRYLRLLHYLGMFLLGFVLAQATSLKPFSLNAVNLFQGVFLVLSIASAWCFSVGTNNLADQDIDRVVNPERPTIAASIPEHHYRCITYGFLALACLYAGSVNFESLFLVLVFVGNYYLYSMPPLRLKRVPFFSKFLISVNGLALIVLGYIYYIKNARTFFNLYANEGFLLFILMAFTAAINFIDLKDYEGDKAAGIRTLPVILGLERSKAVIGFFFLFAYIAAPVLFKNKILFLPAIILGSAQYYLINRREYDERPVFILYLLSIYSVIFLIKLGWLLP
ncbi:MAG: UbiA family prenyltransferase [Candidatus Omnitrophica bacterium]|nr:UbiA family prenyltransferase [Candidatus Omnitrophota bacterium]